LPGCLGEREDGKQTRRGGLEVLERLLGDKEQGGARDREAYSSKPPEVGELGLDSRLLPLLID
jgi:hypothetical protein